MERHKKTARELADMIVMKLSVAGVRRSANGWQADVYGHPPDRVARAQTEAERIATDLGVCYEL